MYFDAFKKIPLWDRVWFDVDKERQIDGIVKLKTSPFVLSFLFCFFFLFFLRINHTTRMAQLPVVEKIQSMDSMSLYILIGFVLVHAIAFVRFYFIIIFFFFFFLCPFSCLFSFFLSFPFFVLFFLFMTFFFLFSFFFLFLSLLFSFLFLHFLSKDRLCLFAWRRIVHP